MEFPPFKAPNIGILAVTSPNLPQWQEAVKANVARAYILKIAHGFWISYNRIKYHSNDIKPSPYRVKDVKRVKAVNNNRVKRVKDVNNNRVKRVKDVNNNRVKRVKDVNNVRVKGDKDVNNSSPRKLKIWIYWRNKVIWLWPDNSWWWLMLVLLWRGPATANIYKV